MIILKEVITINMKINKGEVGMKRFVVSLVLVVGILFGIPTLGAVASTEDSLGCSFVEYLSYTEDIHVTIVMEFNYPSLNAAENYDASSMDADTYIAKIREDNRAYYSVKNQEYIMENGLNELEYSCSSYSPFVFFYYADYQEYLEDREMFVNLSQTSSSISLISVEEKNHKTECVDINENALFYGYDKKETISMEEAKELINVHHSRHTGNGVNIGIVDEGGVIRSSNFPNGTLIELRKNSGHSHTTKVASIIGGTTGIARDAKLYVDRYGNPDDKIVIEAFIKEGIHIINCSYGDGTEGYYNGTCGYFDKMSYENKVTFVTSAGNAWKNKKISNPGMAMNVIAVGSVDKNKVLSYYSSYAGNEEYNDVFYKPNLVAPGEGIVIPNTDNDVKNISGTSFSAPMVTGTIALLMEEFPELKYQPDMIMSILMSGATSLKGQTLLNDRTVGAGLLNYDGARAILLNKNTARYEVSKYEYKKGECIGEFPVYIPAQQEAVLYGVHLIQSTEGDLFTLLTTYYSKYRLEIYTDDGACIYNKVYNGNVLSNAIENTTSQNQNYLVKIIMDSEYSDIEKIHFFSISYAMKISYKMEEQHSYNATFIEVDEDNHRTYCSCGAKGKLESHIYRFLKKNPKDSSSYCKWQCICGKSYPGHNYKYEIIDENTHKGTCECEESIITSSHIAEVQNCHTAKCKDCGYLMVDNSYAHEYEVTKVNEEYHRLTCACGESSLEKHTPSNPNGTHNKGKCTKCGTPVIEHSYDTNNCEYYTNDHHKAYCECGIYELRPHVVSKTWVKNGKTYGTCIECKTTIEMGKGLIVPPGLLRLNYSDKNSLFLREERKDKKKE